MINTRKFKLSQFIVGLKHHVPLQLFVPVKRKENPEWVNIKLHKLRNNVQEKIKNVKGDFIEL